MGFQNRQRSLLPLLVYLKLVVFSAAIHVDSGTQKVLVVGNNERMISKRPEKLLFAHFNARIIIHGDTP